MLHDPNHHPHSRRIAVVGAGVAGLSAAWLLSQRHDVTLYEKETRLGGHANTVDVDTPYGRLAVDTGFIVYNPPNYPNFTALLDHFGIESVLTDMSFSASSGNGRFEYSSDFPGIVGQKRNIVRPEFWRFVSDIVRFYKHAEALIDSPEIEGVSLGTFVERHGYSPMMVEHHILPMCAAIWSSSANDIRAFPMQAFVRFFKSHNLFSIGRRETWKTVKGGSRSYVKAVASAFHGQVRGAAKRIVRQEGLVLIEDETGNHEIFSDVIIAAHADEALSLLADPDAEERAILGSFRYTQNRAVLHDDVSLMPKRRSCWAGWNYIGCEDEQGDAALCVSYWMNKLQVLDRRHPLIVTLNPPREPKAKHVMRSFDYSHPLFDQAALDAQSQLWRLQGQRNTWFCGSYFGYGFHEDALQSGLAVAEQFGVQRPWTVDGASSRIALRPEMKVAAE